MHISRVIDAEGIIHFAEIVSEKESLAVELTGDWAEGFVYGKRNPFRFQRAVAPIAPPMILALGVNYRRHAEETGLRIPEIPLIFQKGINGVIGPKESIILPCAGPDEVDYEAELAVVIGRGGKNISLEKAEEAVFGYTCANDVSARDWQIRLQMKQWSRGKSFDSFCPLGPCITSRDEVKNVQKLAIRAILNDRIVQHSNTSDMVFTIPEIVYHASRSVTLAPGTVILTGTPEGVGYTRNPPLFLRPKDRIAIEIEGLGRLENTVDSE